LASPGTEISGREEKGTPQRPLWSQIRSGYDLKENCTSVRINKVEQEKCEYRYNVRFMQKIP
jgi:hypothetical protein